MLHRLANGRAQLKPCVEPAADCADQAHGGRLSIWMRGLVCGGKAWCWQLASLNQKFSVENLECIFEQAPLRRTRCPCAVLVVNSAMARAHEESRLRKPSHGATQVRAVDREYLEAIAIDVTHPAREFRSFPVRGVRDGIAISGQARLARGKIINRTKRDPALISGFSSPAHGREEITHDRYGEQNAHRAVE